MRINIEMEIENVKPQHYWGLIDSLRDRFTGMDINVSNDDSETYPATIKNLTALDEVGQDF